MALGVLTVGSACERSPTEPPQPAALSASRIGPIERPGKPRHAIVLVPCSALPDRSVTKAIGPAGGSITVGPHVLFIPAGALKRRVSITATIQFRPKGLTGKEGWQVNAIGFKPKLKFQKPAYLVMSYANCDPAYVASLLACTPMPTTTATQTVGSAGGAIKIGPHTLSIPAGALGAPVTITATAPSGDVNRIQFQPEGLVFQRSAALTMSYANCNLLGKLLPKRIVYTDDALNILSYLLSLDNLFAKAVTGKLSHFSNYAIAW